MKLIGLRRGTLASTGIERYAAVNPAGGGQGVRFDINQPPRALRNGLCFDVFHGRNEATPWLTISIL
jgi:hypothetical protein